MKVTVIVPTYQGRNKLPALFSALLRQHFQDFELIVVVDGSTDESVPWLKTQQHKFGSLKIIEQLNQGRASARNNGAQSASGDLLIFYDDDMEPGVESIERHLEFHKKNKQALLGGNPVEYPSDDKTDIQNYRAWLSEKWTKKYPAGISKLNIENLFFTGANCSMKKETWSALSGFTVQLSDAEDFDLAYRALMVNIEVYFDKDNRAIHNDRVTCVKYVLRLREYTMAHKKLQQLYPNRLNEQRKKVKLINRLVYRIAAIGSLPYLIDHFSLRLFIPRKIRFKLYSIIIQALTVEYPDVRLL